MNDGAPHTILAARRDNDLFLCIDGQLDGVSTVPEGFGSTFNDSQVIIGGRQSFSGSPTTGINDDFNGTIDDLRVYDVAVTELGPHDNSPPEIISEPVTKVVLSAPTGAFTPGRIFLSSSRTDEVRAYDAETLEFIGAFTHPLFSDVNSTSFTFGPNGMAFNKRGNLVVAAFSHFVEFEGFGVEFARYPKLNEEATESIIFDRLGNLYTTTATGGLFIQLRIFLSSSRTDEVRAYDAETLEFIGAFTHPLFSDVNSTSFTFGPNGMAFNKRGNLVVAAFSHFVEFEGFGVEFARYPKLNEEATESTTFVTRTSFHLALDMQFCLKRTRTS